MIPAIGLAMGAMSTVSSLVGQAASGIASAASGPTVPAFPATVSPASKAKAMLPSAAIRPGVPIPKFDKRTHAHLLAQQEHHLRA